MARLFPMVLLLMRSLAASTLAGLTAIAATPTFNKDVLPILQKNCQECHRPGEVAPMSLLTYQDARPWAKAIKTAVLTKKMPPWFAEPSSRHFSNERKLSEAAIRTLASWADHGAPEGNPAPKDKPAPIAFREGWNIKPDKVIEMPNPMPVAATGAIEYTYMVAPGDFSQDVWVKAAELRQGNRAVVHHQRAYLRPPGSKFLAGLPYGVAVTLQDYAVSDIAVQNSGSTVLPEIFVKWNPGVGASAFDVDGAAKLVPKGSDIVFESHLTPKGQSTSDRSRLGIELAKEPPRMRYLTIGGMSNTGLVIPPGDPNYEVYQEVTLADDAKLHWIQPHMHLRGKDWTLTAIYPSGEKEVLLKAPFSFEWQIGYELEKPVLLPRGTRLIGVSHFDNSPNNPLNPDPLAVVRFGAQSWDEMSVCFFGLVIDLKTDPSQLLRGVVWSSLPTD